MRGEDQFIIFHLGKEEFGIQIAKAHEIVMMKKITKLPQSSDFIEGVINLRGDLIVIVDLRKRFSLAATISSETRIIIMEINNVKTGLIVDSISEVLRIRREHISDPPREISGIREDYIEGIGMIDTRLIILLKLDQIFSMEEIQELKNIEVHVPPPKE